MSHSRAEPWDWHSDMQFAGKLALSAAALLLGTLVYRLYKSRPARSPPGGGTARAEAAAPGEADVAGPPEPAGQPEPARSPPGAGLPALRPRARVRREEGAGGSGAWGHGQPEGARDCLGEAAVGPGKDRLLGDCDPEPGPAEASDGPGDSRPEPGLLRDRARGQGEGAARAAPGPEQAAARREDAPRSWGFTQAAGAGRGGAGLVRAASDMGLALSRRAGEADTCYLFSSLARARVEESLLGARAPEERPGGPGLKGKIYDYYVESTSRCVSTDRPAPPLPSLPESRPKPPPGRAEGPRESPPAAPGPSLSRKESFLQIAENPELQLRPDSPRPPGPRALPAPAAPPGARPEPEVERVAGTSFFRLPLGPGAAENARLDLGNCSEALRLAKREKLPALEEAAYRVMSDNYLQVLQSPDIYGRLSGAERELILQRRLRGQKRLVVADVCPQGGGGRLCAYDEARDAWWPLAALPPEATSRGCALCSLFNYLFVVAGCPRAGGRASNRVFCYNPLTGIWREMCPLNQARPRCKLVALDGYMYAIGGECLYTVERYDPRQDRWAFVAPLPNDTFALAHTATACDGEIYVTGGTLRYLLLRYSGREDRWRASPAAGGKDRTAEMAAVGGFLYRFDLNRSLGIGVYRCSARARLWYECATYRAHYPAAFQCAVVGNLIHCVGRQFHLRFLADYVSPRFLPNEPRGFPSPQGTLIPAVLALPALGGAQTRV
ncbi:kelch domain-containing protein 7A [Sarcophilus harrisii]|uniref:Kelch domain containing 7A n=1 Tax=Sarcophilus harrisii TaxID=9305 RepID=A0A7N4Q1K9_SARHA|nr:kelch domain-containing protein 7A [Sarcophilus harrisii]